MKSTVALTGTAAYIANEYLIPKTASEVTAQTEVGVALNDGNRAKAEGNLDLEIAATYANPYSEKDRAANADAFKAIDAQAAQNIQHVNGVYTVAGQLFYGKDSKGKAVKYGDALASLDGTKLAIGFYPVTVDSKAKAYSISGAACTDLGAKTPDAIAAGAMSTLTATTDKLGTFGVTYSTAEDLQKEAEANQPETPEVSVPQTLAVAFTKANVKAKTLKKKSVTLKIKGQAANKVTYKVTKKASKKISVSKKGVVTMKKGAKKGTYKVAVTAAAGNGLKAAKKTVKIVVK